MAVQTWRVEFSRFAQNHDFVFVFVSGTGSSYVIGKAAVTEDEEWNFRRWGNYGVRAERDLRPHCLVPRFSMCVRVGG